ncbi:MAG: hypothetical protein [Wendovervirus sonii]|uniref:Uncharacterized protein n=1 Tax=phage Lak_Megaphage_Sonny TaxID=3109229 RepID=A0ABZ0Z3J0_9CAUD|nr:MAG: hypothetical protein [phage Lak_Megaphage_Sonny]
MDNRYFPHYSGGALNPTETSPIDYNMMPNDPIAMDPRQIITEWSTESLKTLKKSDIYVGQEIYSLQEKNTYICRWIPNAPDFSGNECVWDVNYSSDTTNNWIDVKNYSPKNIEDKIKEAQATEWSLNLKPELGYWGFFGFDTLDPEEINKQLQNKEILNLLLNKIIMNISNPEVLAGQLNALDLTAVEHQKSITNKKEIAFDAAKGKIFVMLIPDIKDKLVQMKSLNINDVKIQDKDLKVFYDDLKYLTKEYDYENVKYTIYAYTANKFNDSKLTINYVLEKRK